MRRISLLGLVVATALLLSACGGQPDGSPGGDSPAGLQPITIALPTWTGYGPLFLARDAGIFAEKGLEVELIVIQGLAERKQALAGKQIDGMATALDVQGTLAAAGIPISVVWVLDDSYGGDGILAKKEIATAADLKGKTVAFEVGSTSHLLLLTVLEDAGLSDTDITVAQMGASEAGAAFIAGRVDAAVTWEPWLSRGVSETDGHLLATTKDKPGIIVDSVNFHKDFVTAYPETVQAFVAAMAEAMDYWKANEQEGNEIMAAGLGIDVAEFVETAKGLKFYDLAGNKEVLGTPEAPGLLYQTLQKSLDFYLEKGVIDEKPAPRDIIDPSFVHGIN